MSDFLITVLLGWFGIHKFMQGKTKMGLLYLFTFGLFGIGWIIDIIIAATKIPSLEKNSSANSANVQYDMDTLQGIRSIPVPAQNYNTGDWTKDCIYYVLQRKAAEHKKAGRMDLAIACLRKSNELSDYEKHPLLTQKDYFRLVKYIELTGDTALANYELNKIRANHPEFEDKRISNLRVVQEVITRNKEYGNDLVFISTNSLCPICKNYNRKVFSISGKHAKYPKLPTEFIEKGGLCRNCTVTITTFFEGISTDPD